MESTYLNPKFTRNFDISNISVIFEVGARDGNDSVELAKYYNKANIYTFECNPLTTDICSKSTSKYSNISFFPFGLGDREMTTTFYPYMNDNIGASSFFKRIDFSSTQSSIENVRIETLKKFCSDKNIDHIDILCMDTQGYELNILKGADDMINKIHYIILEQPKNIPNTTYLPDGIHSKYIGAPTASEIVQFLTTHGFVEIERIFENHIEDNVMYKNVKFT